MAVLKINGKEYTKEKPTVNDWLEYLDWKEKNGTKNVLETKDAAMAVLEFVAAYFNVPIDEIKKAGDLEPVVRAHQSVQKDIFSAFTKAQDVWVDEKNAEGQES